MWKRMVEKNTLIPKSSSLNEMNLARLQDMQNTSPGYYYKNQIGGFSTTKLMPQSLNIPNIHCNNCGKQGHLFHQCKLPITSYGMIVCRSSERGIEFLMIRRKDSFGYIDFMRGKYSPYNLEQLQNSINEMSISEKKRILNESFESLWKKLWGLSSNSQYRNEEMSSSKKFQFIKNGVTIESDTKVTLKELVESSTTSWEETEWEFPKGRRNNQEKDLDCALREFQEETGYSMSDIVVVENILPFEEIYIGSNHKSYKHKYFLGYMNKNVDNLQNYQKSEVSKIEWKTIDECLHAIRPYNLEKKKIIQNVYKMLQEYRLYS
jgi:8-oxo-dGTP pyrophosphatase MutT (NUDIX family)